MAPEPTPPDESQERLRVPIWHMVLLAIAVSVLPSFVAVVLLDGGVDQFPDTRSIIVDLVAPSAVGFVAVGVYVTVRRAWKPVWRDPRPVRPWVLLLPISLILTAVLATDFGRLIDAGTDSLIGLLGILLLATNEEIVFRGLILQDFRRRTTENKAAWASSIAFGLIHFLGGPILVLVTTLSGHVFYYSRRVGLGLPLAIVAHFAWNYSLFSSVVSSNPADTADSSVYLTLVVAALLLIVWLARKHIEPRPRAA